MKYLRLYLLLAFALGACSTAKIQTPTATPSATATPIPLTPSPLSTATPKPTFTLTPTAKPVVSGTPLNNYDTVPIPVDAIWGMNTADRYIFTSKQSPTNISSYYQQTLPLNGWDVYDVSILSNDEKDGTEICMAISQIDGLLQGVICISKKINDELTYVRITLFITD